MLTITGLLRSSNQQISFHAVSVTVADNVKTVQSKIELVGRASCNLDENPDPTQTHNGPRQPQHR